MLQPVSQHQHICSISMLMWHVMAQGIRTSAPGDDYVLQPDDILHFEGDYKQAQLYSDVLGFELLTSEDEGADAGLGGKVIDPNVLEKAAPPAVPHKRVLVQVSLSFPCACI